MVSLLLHNACRVCCGGTVGFDAGHCSAVLMRCSGTTCDLHTPPTHAVQVMLFKSETGRSRVAHVSMRDMKVGRWRAAGGIPAPCPLNATPQCHPVPGPAAQRTAPPRVTHLLPCVLYAVPAAREVRIQAGHCAGHCDLGLPAQAQGHLPHRAVQGVQVREGAGLPTNGCVVGAGTAAAAATAAAKTPDCVPSMQHSAMRARLHTKTMPACPLIAGPPSALPAGQAWVAP